MKLWSFIAGALGLGIAVGSAQAADAPTFNRDIAPIVFANCSNCHRPGEVAPFPLLSYKDVKKHLTNIVDVTHSRYMPPWQVDGQEGEFIGERRLTAAQIALFKAWADKGAPEGNPGDLPAAPRFKEGWLLGEPDLVVKMPKAYTVPAEGRDVFRCFVLPLNISEDKYVRAVEFRPSNRRVVHHALFFLDTSGKARELEAADPGPGPGYERMGGVGFLPSGGLGGWSPGAFPPPLPDDYARLLKKGSDLVIQVHFHPTGKVETEQSTIGIYLKKTAPRHILIPFTLSNRKIDIPPGEKNYKVTKSFVTPIAAEVVGITPHAHLLCKDMNVWATFPDGTRKTLIHIPDWDFNWQDQYLYKSPVKLPRGTTVEMEFTYDNSSDNIRNPSNPPRRVTFGEQTTNEMAFTFLQVVPDTSPLASQNNRQAVREFLQRLSQRRNDAARTNAEGNQ